MGFPSPANDYVEKTLTVNDLVLTPNSHVLETETGYVVIDKSLKPRDGDYCYVSTGAGMDFMLVRGRRMISRDGNVLEGEMLDDAEIIGVKTFECIRAYEDSRPV